MPFCTFSVTGDLAAANCDGKQIPPFLLFQEQQVFRFSCAAMDHINNDCLYTCSALSHNNLFKTTLSEMCGNESKC